ncbi:phospholipase D family protein [Aquiflexum gelatinilyticum]|uniref:Phospholipase D family protein n=1 Tax=Aquiflexum gelatinilyticum TaxID=2961943 RepID=A0A9X2P8K4_9BACT|nr:phospholipase D family protein [Aquiflexum gelatinilyticum]MCR9015765.1 phospholipase D family protein [Aquiflexum gelatinilyticum]
MAKFLNTDLINEWIPKLISEAESELIIIVPYIKTSDRIFKYLWEANKRGIAITLIYRENKLSQTEKDKLYSLDNLNLMHHPNVHAKCYYSENYLLITSMNLYEYSEKNNREMGVLLHKVNLSSSNFMSNEDSDDIFQDAIAEIKTIINSSQFEKENKETKEGGFEIDLIKSNKDRVEEYCKYLNKIFVHKRFEADGEGHNWWPICKNYFDRIDVIVEHRYILRINYPEDRLKQIFDRFKPHYNEYKFRGFKFYWNYHTSTITLYRDGRIYGWDGISEEEDTKKMKNGLDELITFLRQFI